VLAASPRRACAKIASRTKAAAKGLVVPLFWRDGGFCLRYRAAGEQASSSVFWGVADTGSPFLLLGRCLRRDCDSYCPKWGCYEGQGEPSDLPETVEVYISGQRSVEWRQGLALTFPDARLANEDKLKTTDNVLPDLVFGVQGAMQGTGGTGGGVYFGLIRDHSPDIRPSFLEQTPYQSMVIDLRQPKLEALTLEPRSLLANGRGGNDVLELLDTRCYGGPVRHYAAVTSSVLVGGDLFPRKILCIFDTGTTGLALTEGAFQEYFSQVRRKAGAGVRLADARKLEVRFTLQSGRTLSLKMRQGRHPVYGEGLDLVTPIPEVAWSGVGDAESIAGYTAPGNTGCPSQSGPLEAFDDVAFLGLGFFVGKKLTIDAEAGLLAISSDDADAV